jgi:hypothetical protein
VYIAAIIALALVLPFGSALLEALCRHSDLSFLALCGKWFAFWAAGMRLFLAGLRQTMRPQFTAREIFALESREALPVVRELGFANLAMGAVGLLSLPLPGLRFGAALIAGFFYAFAGVQHALAGQRSPKRNIAMLTDILIAIVLLVYCASSRT